MSVCPAVPPDVMPAAAEESGAGLLSETGIVAVRVADLHSPAGVRRGMDGRTALVTAGAGRVRTGDVVVFCKPVAIAPAVVRRDGRVQAAGHPADHARLGLAEDRLDDLCGAPGAIDEIAAAVTLEGKVKGAARRAMTPALAVRFSLLMTLIPDADYAGVMDALFGDLALVPWQRPYRVPTATVACTCREAIGRGPLEELRDRLLAGIDAGHRQHDYRAVTVGDLDACPIDGSLTRIPDTPANREASGSAGTADDSSPIRSCGSCGALMAPFYEGICQGHGPSAVEGMAALVGVNVVRPVGRSTLTPRARRRVAAAAGAMGCGAGRGGGSVWGAGPGSG